MHSLRLSRPYLNCLSKSLIEKRCPFLCSSHFGFERLLCTDAPRVNVEDANKASVDTFGTLSSKTEDNLGRWVKKIKIIESIKNKPKVNTPKHSKNSDTFGLLEPADESIQSSDTEKYEIDEKSEVIERRRRPIRWKTPNSYGREMQDLIEQKKLREALIMYKKMLEVDMVKPNAFVYNVLINGCGKNGFTSMAFKLFKEMRERGIVAEDAVWTGLFNSCANCPFVKYGLKNARSLYRSVTEKGYALNARNYHAAIKAFGRCGDMRMGLKLVDEMVQKKVVVSTETFNFLLMGCASDKKSGFLHAIMIWRKMLEKRIRPSIFSYNLLLRVTRDCNVGDINLAEQLLLPKINSDTQPIADIKYLEAEIQPTLENAVPTTSVQQTRLPNVLSPYCQPGSVTKLLSLDTPQDRLALLGSLPGLLSRMTHDGVQPDKKTFTQLIEIIPSDLATEENLLTEMERLRIDRDVDFYNVLIKKRNLRNDFTAAKAVLTLIGRDRLLPDIATFGSMAVGCRTLQTARQLLEDIETVGFRPNTQIMGAFVSTACIVKDFWYAIEMLKVMKRHEIKPDSKLIEDLEDCVKWTKASILQKEKKGARFAPDDPFVKGFQTFLVFYKYWLKNNEMEMTIDPWSSYRPPKNIDEILDSENIQ